MNFLWLYIIACCCNKNNAKTCTEHKKPKKHCHNQCSQGSCLTPPPKPCQPKPDRECSCQTPPPPPSCQPPQNQGCPCQETQIPQELFQDQGRFCQQSF